MNNITYIIIATILIIIIIIYYYIQKPKKSNIELIYGKYLLKSTTPDIAFTYKQLPNGDYENYYKNFNIDDPSFITKEINKFPVNGDGTEYKPTEHGTLTETDKGFTITGCDTVFECPTNWHWDLDKKYCVLDTLCKNTDIGMIKGVDFYHFNLLDLKNYQSKTLKYHDRLYVICKETDTFEIKECFDNSIFNQKPLQPATENPCNLYDICQDLRQYTIHKKDIGNGVILNDDEYYICIDSKSVLKKCAANTVFNIENNGCVELNKCALQENGYTFPIDADSYTLCTNGKEFVVNCVNSVYEDNGMDHLECKIDKSLTFINYYTNNHIGIPTSLYTYANNKADIFYANNRIETRYISLATDNSGFFKTARNVELFEPVEFQMEFVQYADPNTKEVGISTPLTIDNYKPFARTSLISVSYYEEALESFLWNVFEDRPNFTNPEDVYYRYDTKIKHKTDTTIDYNTADYFFFITSKTIHKPKESTTRFISQDYNSGIMHYVDTKMPTQTIVSDLKLTLTLKILNYEIMPDERLMYYFTNPFNSTINAIVWNKDFVLFNAFEPNPDIPGFVRPVLYNHESTHATNTRTFHMRLSSINWAGAVIENHVLPEMLAIIGFSEYAQLDKQFEIINSEPLYKKTNLSKFSTNSVAKYVPFSDLTGDYNYLLNIQNSININFLNSYG